MNEPAVRTDFTDYLGTDRQAVDLGSQRFGEIDGLPTATADMRLADGTAVTIWFTELRKQPDSLDAYELLKTATTCMRGFAHATRQPIDAVVVPAFTLTYATPVNGPEVDGAPEMSTRQRFAAALDEDGARVIALTIMQITGVPDLSEEPVRYVFGERGPVIIWLSEGSASMPFSILYTSSLAWAQPDTEIDLSMTDL